jgi:cell division protein YceG involved in septum cleavage
MDFKIDDETRLNFDKMLKESGASDNTAKIRKLKHSSKIREQVTIMMDIKKNYSRLGKRGLEKMIESKCNWLFTNYTNIFNKLKKGELNLTILNKFLSTLKDMEDGDMDQHEASVKIGQILKELYIDSALQQEKKQNEKDKRNNKKYKRPKNNLSWEQYKKLNE